MIGSIIVGSHLTDSYNLPLTGFHFGALLEIESGEGAVVLQIKRPASECLRSSSPPLAIQLPVDALGRQQMTAQVLGFLPLL